MSNIIKTLRNLFRKDEEAQHHNEIRLWCLQKTIDRYASPDFVKADEMFNYITKGELPEESQQHAPSPE